MGCGFFFGALRSCAGRGWCLRRLCRWLRWRGCGCWLSLTLRRREGGCGSCCCWPALRRMGQGSEDERDGVSGLAGICLCERPIGDLYRLLGLRLGLPWRAARDERFFARIGGWIEKEWRCVKHEGGCVAAGRRWHLSCSSQRRVSLSDRKKHWAVVWECNDKNLKCD